MMTDQEVRTLAYAKSPKTSKRTTFQDELQAAVSSRASKANAQQHFYFDDINDDEDDFLDKLLKSRKKRIDAFKAGRSKATFNTFEFSDEEDKPTKPKKVSFLKSHRSSSNSKDTSGSDPHESSNDGNVHNDGNVQNEASLYPQNSTNVSAENSQINPSSEKPTNGPLTKQTSSLSCQISDDALSLPLPSDGTVVESPGPEEDKTNPGVKETSETPPVSAPHLCNTVSTGSVPEMPPKPKPRQRTLGMKSLLSQKKRDEESEFQDFSRPQTSSMSIPFSTDASSNITWTDGDQTASCSPSKSFSNKSEQSQLVTRSTFDSGSRGFISDDSKEQGRPYSSSFEEFNGHAGDPSDQSSHALEKSFDTKTSCSHSKTPERSQSACSRKVESKYLGTLKVLDRKLSLQESSPQAPEAIRAAVYQEWLKKKKEKSRENMRLKKKEELVKKQQKKDRESKKEHANASFEAWKEKKAESLKAEAKERQNMIRKQQRENKEKEERRQSAIQVFENWKREYDQLLIERNRKQKVAESKQKLKKQEKEEERQRESKSAFSDWCDKKKDLLHEKLKREREEIKTKAEEELYLKEEKDKMAIETYENWLIKKDREQRRRKDERVIQEILRDSPPPPWNPPNKTIPFRK
ncbi:microtubule-associated protein 9 [Poecilia formosa]|uniref:Microtubule-associated protein 9 n=1 Tax=Poecilia formosa TaxID=48698 RepID=A0A096MES9_POEFO|nr:PREDICTED: microtubule-associated protein 9 [Poecilia formosa]